MSASTIQIHPGYPALAAGHDDMSSGQARGVGPGLRLRFARTSAGEAEHLQHALGLSAAARAVLGCLDRERAIDDCLDLLPQAALDDAMALLAPGLVRITSCVAMSRRAPDGVELRPLVELLMDLSADDLYLALTHQAKLRLGLLHGFRMVLALERCVGLDRRRALALRFIGEIWRTSGEREVAKLLRYLRG